jgi:hypothetical protein
VFQVSCRWLTIILIIIIVLLLIPVAERSKAWVWSRSPAGIAGLNPAGDMDVCLLWVLCVVRHRSLRRADHSSRGVQPTVVRPCVWSRNLKNEEAKTRKWVVKASKEEEEEEEEECYYYLLLLCRIFTIIYLTRTTFIKCCSYYEYVVTIYGAYNIVFHAEYFSLWR